LEDRGDHVVVSVRDDGPGISPGRLAVARAEGRLGVSESILGRVSDLGGTADLVSTSGQGTEWEITLPKTVAIPL
jgi:signal transduction histidine kinase